MRAGKGKHVADAEYFMRKAGERWDWYDSHISMLLTLIARKGLYSLIFDGAQRVNNISLMSIMARKIDWAHDISIVHRENAETCLQWAKDSEHAARVQWALADGMEKYDTYED